MKYKMEIHGEAFEAEVMGVQLKKLRKSLKLSQEKFAEMLGMSKDTIFNYEKGKTAIPHDVIKRLCQEFHISADYFYFEKDKDPLSVSAALIQELFTGELEQCTELEKKQLLEMLKILRMKPAAV